MQKQKLFPLCMCFFLVACILSSLYALWDFPSGIFLYFLSVAVFSVIRFSFFPKQKCIRQEEVSPKVWRGLQILYLITFCSFGILLISSLYSR